VEQRPVEDAVGPVNNKIVVLVGHDTNLAGWPRSSDCIGRSMGEGRYAAGTELTFELWQNESGAYFVRATVAMQTLKQMRELRELSLDTPPAREVLTVDERGTEANTCRWDDFQVLSMRQSTRAVSSNSSPTDP